MHAAGDDGRRFGRDIVRGRVFGGAAKVQPCAAAGPAGSCLSSAAGEAAGAGEAAENLIVLV